MMETAAEYYEKKIKTYGFTLQIGLTLFNIQLPHDQIGAWGRALSVLSEAEFRFEWVSGRGIDTRFLHLSLLCETSGPLDTVKTLERTLADLPAGSLSNIRPVDVISFHGPHYGDRYGIADCALSALRQRNIPLIGMTCAIAGISLVLPPGQGEEARQLLTTIFEIPRTTSSVCRQHRKK